MELANEAIATRTVLLGNVNSPISHGLLAPSAVDGLQGVHGYKNVMSDCRVFYGTKDAMVERTVTSVEWGGAMSAPTQTIDFVVDSVSKQIQLGGTEFSSSSGPGLPADAAAADTDIVSSHTYFCLD